MIFYIVLILSVNFLLPVVGFQKVGADVTISDLFEFHNRERAKAGLQPLILNTTLSNSATAKAATMMEIDCWSHYCPPEKDPWDYFAEAGYNYQYAGENLAEGFDDIESVMNAWMNSPTHKENIMNPDFKEIGFGFAFGDFQGKENNIIISVHFGTKFEPKPVLIEDIITKDTTKNEPEILDVSVNETINPDVQVNQLPQTISITSPEDGSFLKYGELNVVGIVSPENSTISVEINDENVGSVDAIGENFIYRNSNVLPDGNYTVKSFIKNTNIEDSVDVSIDSVPPRIYTESINVNKENPGEFILEFQVSEEDLTILTSVDYVSLKQDSDTSRYFITFNEDSVLSESELIITLSDMANNNSQFILDTDEIKDVLSDLVLPGSILDYSENSTTGLIGNFFKELFRNDIKSMIPIAFVIYLLSLFIIDYVVLVKTDKLQFSKKNSHINLAIVLILLILFSFGSLNGSILTTDPTVISSL